MQFLEDPNERLKKLDELTNLFQSTGYNSAIGNQLRIMYSKLFAESVVFHQKSCFDFALKINFKIAESAKKTSNKYIECQALYGICECFRTKNELEECLKYCSQALELAEAENIAEIKSKSLNNLGLVYQEQGNYWKALSNLQAALKISKENNLLEDLILQIRNIGRYYHFVGDFQLSEEFLKLALDFSKRYRFPRVYASANNELAILYLISGRNKEAIRIYEKNLQYAIKIQDIMFEETCYNNLGTAYRQIGHLQKALENHKKALDIARNIGDKKEIATALNNIAVVYSYWGKNEPAYEMYIEVLKYVDEIGANYKRSGALLNLAATILHLNKNLDSDKSKDQEKHALELIEEAYNLSIKINDKRNTISALLMKINFFEDIVEKSNLIEYAYELASEMESIDLIISCLIIKSEIALEQSDILSATKYIDNAMDFSKKTGDRYSEASLNRIISIIHKNNGEYQKAYVKLKESIDIYEVLTSDIAAEGDRLSFRKSILATYSSMIGLLIEIYSNERKNEHLFDIIKYMEAIKSREIVDKLENESAHSIISCPDYRDLLLKEKEICSIINSIRYKVITQKDQTEVNSSRRELMMKENELRLIRVQIQEKCTDPSFLRISSEFNPSSFIDEVFKHENEAIIWYFLISDEKMNIIAIENETMQLFSEVDIDIRDLGKILQNLNKGIIKGENIERILDELSKYQGNLIDKELWEITLKKNLLIVIPWGIFHTLPWAITTKKDTYLGLEIPSVNANSIILLHSCIKKEVQNEKSKIIAIQNPNFNVPELNLIGAKVEINRISNLFAELLDRKESFIDILNEENATVENFKQKMKSNFDIIHFAGHGEFNAINPWISHLKFYSAESFTPFTATEISLNKFKISPLFILSACETGRERVRQGDELYGLKRGLYLANVNSVIATNWPLLDEIGPYFMPHFYRALISGASVVEALFTARNKIYQKESMTNLYDWGVYDLHGNPFKKFIFK